MANFFEGLWEAAKQPLNEGQFLFDVVRGKTSLKDAPGKHQEMMNKITVPILGDNKIAKNSDAIAGALVGGIMAAPALLGSSGGASGMGGIGGMGTGSVGTSSGMGGVGGMVGSGSTNASGMGGVGGMSGITPPGGGSSSGIFDSLFGSVNGKPNRLQQAGNALSKMESSQGEQNPADTMRVEMERRRASTQQLNDYFNSLVQN